MIELLVGILLGTSTTLLGWAAGWTASRKAREDRDHIIEVLNELDRRAARLDPRNRHDPAREEGS